MKWNPYDNKGPICFILVDEHVFSTNDAVYSFFAKNHKKRKFFLVKNATSSSVAVGFFDERFRRSMQPVGFVQRSVGFFVWFRRKKQQRDNIAHRGISLRSSNSDIIHFILL